MVLLIWHYFFLSPCNFITAYGVDAAFSYMYNQQLGICDKDGLAICPGFTASHVIPVCFSLSSSYYFIELINSLLYCSCKITRTPLLRVNKGQICWPSLCMRSLACDASSYWSFWLINVWVGINIVFSKYELSCLWCKCVLLLILPSISMFELVFIKLFVFWIFFSSTFMHCYNFVNLRLSVWSSKLWCF